MIFLSLYFLEDYGIGYSWINYSLLLSIFVSIPIVAMAKPPSAEQSSISPIPWNRKKAVSMIIYRPRDTVISPFLTLDSPEQVSYDLRKIDLNNLAMQCNPCLSNLYDMWLLMLEQPMYLTVFVSDWFLCLKHLASSCDWKKLEMNMNWNKRSIYQSHSTVLCYEVLIRRSLWTRVWLLPQ